MRFLITFDLPERDYPSRIFHRDTLRDGRARAKQIELTLRVFLEREKPLTFWLYVYDGDGAWAYHTLVKKEMPGCYFIAGDPLTGRGCYWVFDQSFQKDNHDKI